MIEGVVGLEFFYCVYLLISRNGGYSENIYVPRCGSIRCINCIGTWAAAAYGGECKESSRQHKRCGTSFLFFAGDQYYFTVADSGGIAFDAGGCPYCTASGDRRNLLRCETGGEQ